MTQDANALLAASPRSDKGEGKFEEAKEWLSNYLGDYQEHPQKEVSRDAKEAGIANRTLWRAKDALQVRSEKSGLKTGWTWCLPSPIADVRIHPMVGNSSKREDT